MEKSEGDKGDRAVAGGNLSYQMGAEGETGGGWDEAVGEGGTGGGCRRREM